MSSLSLYQGARAAEEILRSVYRIAPIEKALDPLKPKEYEQIVKNLAFALKGKAVPVEDAALKKALGTLDVDWTHLPKEARWKVIDAAKGYLGAPLAHQVVPEIQQTLTFASKDLITTTKSKTVQKFDLKIAPSFSATDAKTQQIVLGSQGHYVRDAYGKRADTFGVQAKQIVASGLEKGLGSADIAEALHANLQAAGRSPSYWNMIAMVFANRARTMTQIFAYGEAGLQYYLWESVLDEVTSMQCRFLHGRRFAIGKAIQSVYAVEDADSPEDIKTIQPFLQCSGASLYFGTGEKRTPVATITQNVVGQANHTGSYADAMDTDQLEAAGIRMPPIHGRCRSTVIPDFSGPGPEPVSVQVPAAPEMPPPKPSIADAKATALAALETASTDGLVYLNDFFKSLSDVGEETAPFLEAFASPAEFQEVFEANAITKKPKLKELVATQATGDETKTKGLITSPKKLDAQPPPKVVRYKGNDYIVSGHETLLAKHLLGQKAAYVQWADLDKAIAAKPKPPPLPTPQVPPPPHPPAPPLHAPALAPAPAPGTAENILGTKLAGPGGSNAGGIYLGKDGVERYVKFYDDPSQAHGEHLANQIYKDLGHDAPVSTTFEHEGKTAYASVIVKGVQTLGDAGLTKERARDAMKGFIGDVLTGNWDAAGLHHDNMVVTPHGGIIRIDNGGTFLMRAKNGRKDAVVLNAITEWEKFFDPNVNKAYAKVASAAGYTAASDMKDVVLPQIEKLLAIRDAHGGWAGYVERIAAGLPADDKAAIVKMLDARSDLLQAKMAELKLPVATPPRLPKLPKQTPSSTFNPPPVDLENMSIRKLEQLPKRDIPTNVSLTYGSANADEFKRETKRAIDDHLSTEQQAAIRMFTKPGVGYGNMRAAQVMTREQFAASADSWNERSASNYDRWKHLAETAESSFDTDVPRRPGQVFRALRDLPRETVDKMIEADHFDLRGTSSTTRVSNISIENFLGGIEQSSDYKVFLVIHQKTAIPIETISAVKSECELLMSGKSKLRVLRRHLAETNNRCVIIECEEVL